MPTSLPTLYGAAYSAYVRVARMALIEKGIAYELIEIDVFGGAIPDWYARVHPFKRIPAFEHEGFWLYETAAITRYVDEAFNGPPLIPAEAQGRARVFQVVSIIDSYLYRPLVWDIYAERCALTAGASPDEARIAAAVSQVETCFAAIDELILGDGPYILGKQLSLADLYLAPMISLGRHAAEGATLMARHPRLSDWWERMSTRSSLAATATRPEA